MYAAHFGLNEQPFNLTPDTSFFFDYRAHQEAMNVLLVALRMGEGFIKITGEVGSGKTLLCRMLLDQLSRMAMVTAYIPNPCLNPKSLRQALAAELGIAGYCELGQHQLLTQINDELIRLRASGQQVVLLIDEAQALPRKSLEAVRLLTNLETEKHKLLQVVLFGQPELDLNLDHSAVRQLKQRITFSYYLAPMNRAGVSGYVNHRLITAGYSGNKLFSAKALKQLYRGSSGIPRLVNILGHKALLTAFGEGAECINARHVRMAIADTEDAVQSKRLFRPLWVGLLGLTLSTAAAAGIVLIMRGAA